MTKRTVLYISHGGGPLPLLGDDGHAEMVEKLKEIASMIGKPSAILLISAHWEESLPTITAGDRPSLIYDYYGFPEESYQIQYSCSGEPALSEHVGNLLEKAGLDYKLDQQRGFDHGLFVPLKIMFPDADVPCVQLSLLKSLNPVEHIELGSALSDIDYQNLLIIGSGFSFHNIPEFFAPETAESTNMNQEFDRWLVDACSNRGIDEQKRCEMLAGWESAPYARYCHPREEHLLPLHVCYGVSRSPCQNHIGLNVMNKQASFFIW